MSDRRYLAAVNAAGELAIVDRSGWNEALASLRGKNVMVSLEWSGERRSSRQNRYWWGIVVPAYRDIWSPARTNAGLPPYTHDDVHEVLVQVLLGFEDGPLPGTRVRKRSHTLSTGDFAKLVDEARALAREQYGCVIPAPNEPWEEAA